MHMSPVPFALTLVVATLSACGTQVQEGDVAADASEVRVAQCPSTVSFQLGKPNVLRSTPVERHDGAPLAGGERQRVEQVMTQTRALTGLNVSLTLDRTTSGTCFYKGPSSGEAATFRTKSGKNIFQVFANDGLQAYAFPESYSPAGLVFTPAARATLMANVGASGPFSDGASLTVKIGSAHIGAPARAPSSPSVTLASGFNDPVLDGPEELTITAPAGAVEATLVDSHLATCTIVKNEAASSARSTQFTLVAEYEIDDGFNGCNLSFANRDGFRAELDVGINVGD